MIEFEHEIERVVEIVKSGKIILYPTDTIWGIGCDATNANAVQKIYKLKRREEKKSLIILVNGVDMIYDYVSNPPGKLLSWLKDQTHPTSCVFENAIHLPGVLVNEDGTIAIRIVEDLFCKKVITLLKKPLVSTSANISGDHYPANFLSVSEAIKNGVDYVVIHRQNDFSKSLPSSLIKLDTSGEIVKLR